MQQVKKENLDSNTYDTGLAVADFRFTLMQTIETHICIEL